jgi:WD40 repeat protein
MNRNKHNSMDEQKEKKVNPYKELTAYEEEDKDVFKGRDGEKQKLFRSVKYNFLTVLFGKAGIGKTSLLNAGVIPLLRQEEFFPIRVRLNYSQEQTGLKEQIRSAILGEIEKEGIRVIRSEEESNKKGLPMQKGETLWEYFKRAMHYDPKRKQMVTPVLLFDQFEEIFTLGKKHHDVESIKNELYWLIEDQFPTILENRVLEEKWKKKVSWLSKVKPQVGLIISLREDYLPQFTELRGQIPSIDRAMFRLIHLNGKQAREIIRMSRGFKNENIISDILRQFYPEAMEPVDTVPDENLEVEPSLLSLLCYQMFEKGATSLSGQEKDAILSDFYDEVMEKLPRSSELEGFIETRLLTENGFRTPSYLDQDFELREVLEEAINRRILRKFYIGEKEYVEIIHDVLVPVIKMRRDRRLEEKRKQEERQRQKQIISRIVAIAGLIFILLGIIAFLQKNRADRQHNEAESNRIAAVSSNLLPKNNIKAIRIAEAAYRMSLHRPSPSVEQALSAAAYSTFERPFYTTIMEHENMVNSSAFSPDGTKILTTSMDGTAKLWDLSGKILADLKMHTAQISSAVFSPDGAEILTASWDNTAKLWDLNGTLLVNLEHKDKVSSASFSPDGTKIITISWDNTTKLWDLNGKLLANLKHTNYISSAAFSPDGTRIITASWDNTAKLWDLRGKILADFNKHTDYVWSAVFSPDGTKIITASSDKTAKLWDLKGKLLTDLNNHSDKVWNAAFSPNGNTILTCSGNTARIWNLNGSLVADLNKHSDDVNSPVFSYDGSRVLTWSGNTVKIWTSNGNLLANLHHKDYVSRAVFSSDGTKILTWSRNTTKLWDLRNQFLVDLNKCTEDFSKAAISPDCRNILTWSGSRAKLWNLRGKPLADLNSHKSSILCAAFSPDGSKILTASWDKTVKIWDLYGNLLFDLDYKDGLNSAAFSTDGSKIITVALDSTVKLYDLKENFLVNLNMNIEDVDFAILSPDDKKILTWSGRSAKMWDLVGNLLVDLTKHKGDINSSTFSPDGTKILTASDDHTAKLWDIRGNLLADLDKHTDSVTIVIFSPNGTKILTASNDHTAKLWDLRGNILADLNKHTDDVLSAVFSPDGTRILTVSKDGTVKRWYTPDAILQWLKTAPIPELSKEDKKNLGIADFEID